VSVAALGQRAQGFTVAWLSNTGARVSGPGVAVSSARAGGGLTAMSGTSMATPHVAGAAALWAEKLSITGQLKSQLLADRLVASGTADGIKAGTDPNDIGRRDGEGASELNGFSQRPGPAVSRRARQVRRHDVRRS